MKLDPLRSARLGHAVAAEVVGVHGALAEIDGERALRKRARGSGRVAAEERLQRRLVELGETLDRRLGIALQVAFVALLHVVDVLLTISLQPPNFSLRASPSAIST